MTISRKELYHHNLKTKEISGPFSQSEEVCKLMDSISLPDGEFLITEHVTTVEEKDFTHAYQMWQHKKKKKKDVDGEAQEVTKGLPKIITGEVLN